MSHTVLVAYASRYGSTREVAEAVGAALREAGLEADVRPAREARDPAAYCAVVLGAPLFLFRWHSEARRFLSRRHRFLAGRPAAVFATGPCFTGDEMEWREARAQLDKELARFPWFRPAAVEVFGGNLDPGKLRFPFNLFLRQMPANDLRDWAKIHSWALGLAENGPSGRAFQAGLARISKPGQRLGQFHGILFFFPCGVSHGSRTGITAGG